VSRCRLRFAALVAIIATPRGPIAAQASHVTIGQFATGGEFEDYLRVIQIAGVSPLYPWSVRGFSRREIQTLTSADSTGPWGLAARLNSNPVSVDPLTVGGRFNSAYPYGANDGPLWVGKGITTLASGGVNGHIGPLSFAFAPLAFSSANRAFELLPNGLGPTQQYNSGIYGYAVDYPQRFGKSSYSRLDPGASYLRFDTRFVAAGISTANEWIGPATEFPFLLGNNAAGFPHLFLGTGSPLNVGIGRVHSRVMWGRLDQSAYSPVTGSKRYLTSTETGTVRLMAAIEGIFIPRGIPGLELGAARFLHVAYGVGEPNAAFWKKPFRVLFLKNEYAQGDTIGTDNQLAALFFRWVFPHSGLEVYGERGYEDQFFDFREFLENIDHDRAYMIGLQKIVAKRRQGLDVLRAETINYQTSTLLFTRPGEGGIYVHGGLPQGHTNRGQLLGAYPGVGAAAGAIISWTRYSPDCRTAFSLKRILRGELGTYQSTGAVNPKGSDVLISFGAEQMRYGVHLDVGGRAEIMDDLNRNFRHDAGNLNLQLTMRVHAR
jgi:hypothetical protein